MMSPINFNAKRTGEPTALNLHGGFDEAGAGNITKIKIFVNAPALDPTSQSFSTQLITTLVPRHISALIPIAFAIAKLLQTQSFAALQDLLNQALAIMGYQLLLSREDQYQLAFFMLFSMGGLRARVEEVTQDGRIDIVIEMKHQLYVIELKIDQSAAVGIAQIKTKDYARKFKHLKLPMWAIGINLAGKSTDTDAPRNAVLELAAEELI